MNISRYIDFNAIQNLRNLKLLLIFSREYFFFLKNSKESEYSKWKRNKIGYAMLNLRSEQVVLGITLLLFAYMYKYALEFGVLPFILIHSP